MRALLVTTDRLGLVLEELLGPHGYTVERQLDPQRAEQRAAGCALVLLEWDALGAAAAAACRTLAVASGAALVALRHDRAMATMAEALAAGANEVLCLPEERDRLIARAQAAARTVKGRVDDAFLRHPLPSWIFDEQTLAILAVNDAAIRAYGWSRDELLGMTVRDLQPPSQHPRLDAQLSQGRPPSAPGAVWLYRTKNGTPIDVEVVSQSLMFAGRAARIAVARDVTAEVRSAEANRRALDELHAVVERMPDGVFTYRPKSNAIVMVNPALVAMLGCESPAELVGRDPLELVDPADREAVRQRVRQLIENKIHVAPPRPIRFRARDGSLRWLETLELRVTWEDEPAITVIARDLTDRRRADEALRLSEERFYKIFQANPSCIAITRLNDDRFVDVNERFVTMSGYGREELIGKSGAQVGLWCAPELAERLAEAERAGSKVREAELRLTNKAGQPVELQLSLESFSVGGEGFLFAIATDVTEQRRLEQQLRHAQKMEAIGRLAGGVAHDFNNVLTALHGYAEVLTRSLVPGSREHGAADHIQRSARRASSLTEQLLVFTRQKPHEPRVIAVNDVVTAMAALLRRIIGEDIELVLKLAKERLRVRVDPTQLEQVLLNLAVNARDAMVRGGRLTVETAAADWDRVRLSVHDAGAGMSAETRLRAFEPFFTTKEVGKGTGLGLSIVYGVVVQNGGTIAVDSAPGQGSTFHIHLPRVNEPIEEAPLPLAATTVPPANDSPAGGRETILLVEDDEDVRDFVHLVLSSAGYEVLMAPNGVAAIAVADQHPGEIHLLVSDLIMPQMNGFLLVQRLRPTRPRMQVLHMSGYPGENLHRQGELPEGVPFLQKPFSSDALTAAVRAVLDGRPMLRAPFDPRPLQKPEPSSQKFE